MDNIEYVLRFLTLSAATRYNGLTGYMGSVMQRFNKVLCFRSALISRYSVIASRRFNVISAFRPALNSAVELLRR